MDTLAAVRELVSRLKPGEVVQVDWLEMRKIPPLEYEGFVWGPIDRVMEEVVGSAYEIATQHDRMNQIVTFRRLSKPLEGNMRTYVSPDRRERFKQVADCLWVLAP